MSCTTSEPLVTVAASVRVPPSITPVPSHDVRGTRSLWHAARVDTLPGLDGLELAFGARHGGSELEAHGRLRGRVGNALLGLVGAGTVPPTKLSVSVPRLSTSLRLLNVADAVSGLPVPPHVYPAGRPVGKLIVALVTGRTDPPERKRNPGPQPGSSRGREGHVVRSMTPTSAWRDDAQPVKAKS